MDNIYAKELKLLYIEDESSIREILSIRLENVVSELIVAEDGEDGYQKYLENKPDLILTDITMPKLDGIEMSRKIREIDREIPIIVMSAHSDSSYLLDSIEIGIAGYLVKPLNKDKLYNILESNAKIIYVDKVNKIQQKQILEQQKILQNIINTEKNISFVTDFNEVSFANKAFIDFFDLKVLPEFIEKFKKPEDMFIEDNEYIHKGLIQNYKDLDNFAFGNKLYEIVTALDDTKRIVLIKDKLSEQKSFFLSLSILDEDSKLFLINLTDITEMTIQKNNTEYKAYFDGLTNIYNRNKFDEIFNQELLRVKRYPHSLSLAIIDIDNFKVFNDTYGHIIGDEILIMFAQELSKRLRVNDIFARWGGEEFVILYIGTSIDNALIASNILRKHIEQIKHKTAGNVTVSFGISEYKDGDSLESLFKRCDEALYLAKEKGKNRVESIK